jgi:acyl-coenzyme A synthetase/AMP-(fatty) acid ligase
MLVRAPGHEHLEAGSVLADVRARLAGYKVPREVYFTDTLPTLGSGKIDRRAVADLVQTRRGGRSAFTG